MEIRSTLNKFIYTILAALILTSCHTIKPIAVSAKKMESIFQEIKTPYKQGVVFQHPEKGKIIDSPSIFRWNGHWCMTYIVFDGKGYETWLAESEDLLKWDTKCRIMSFTDSGWDANQKAGYMALLDINWKGSYAPSAYENKYWMSYLGGSVKGYEAGRLGVGMANTIDPSKAVEWERLPKPVLSADDVDVRGFERKTIYKSTIIRDKKQLTGSPFVMFYNAKGDTANYESIGMAVSSDMKQWKRFGDGPVISQFKKGTISGDAQILKIGNVYVMFYFGAFWNGDKHAYDRFACSYDLVHWTDWTGKNLIDPSESYDEQFAHKPFVINWKGKVYHFYNAVGKNGRVIALATSLPLK